MSPRQAITSLAYALLKLGAIIFLFPIFWENIQNPDLTGDIILNRLLLWGIGYLVVSFIILVISRENFNMFGFTIILIASVYRIFETLVTAGFNADIALYFFVICVCFYFMTKEFRNKRRMVAGGF